MTVTHVELYALAWAARLLGALAVLVVILALGLWLRDFLLKLGGRWRAWVGLSWLWFYVAKRDRAKLMDAADKYAALNLGREFDARVEAAEARLHRLYENREAYLRAHYDIPADELADRDSEGRLLPIVWSGNIDNDGDA